MSQIVNLDRRFFEWERETPPDFESPLAMRFGKRGLSWDELLIKRRVILLAVAGSGKSTELRERARLMASVGCRAFHALAEDIGSLGLEKSLPAASRKLLAEWKASAEEA